MAFYKYFWDLANSTDYQTHTVGAFDNNCVTGGGVFKWVQADASVITNIPGIRIKPTASNNGYWLRVYEGPVQVSWFGCQNTEVAPYTFQQMGVSQATLNQRYGVGFATVNDYYDNTAIRYALKFMETTNNHGLIFESKNYWISRSCGLPKDSPNSIPERWVIDGSNAFLIKVGNADINFFERTEITDVTTATLYGISSYTIKNFKANGLSSNWLTDNASFIYLPASNGSHIDNIFIEYFPNGIRLEQGRNAKISNINGKNISKRLIKVASGSWTGAIPTNSGSDATEVTHIRSYDSTSSTFSVIEVNGSAGCVVKNCYVEGTPQNTVIFDSQGVASCNSIKIQDMYVPATNQESMIKILGVNGIYMIDNISFSQPQVFVETDLYSGSPNIRLSNVINWPTGTTLADTSGNTWDFNFVTLPPGVVTPGDIIDPLNNLWETTGGYVIPSVTEVRNEPPVSTSPSYNTPTLQEVLNYNHDLPTLNLFMGTEAGDNNTGSRVTAIGYAAAKDNVGTFVIAIDEQAANQNAGNNVIALGNAAGKQNTGSSVTGIGFDAANQNTGSNVVGIGDLAAKFNQGNDLVALGYNAGIGNQGNNVIALGSLAGGNNQISNVTIIANSELPSFANFAAATAIINVGFGATSGTYLYHDQATNSIGAVRIP